MSTWLDRTSECSVQCGCMNCYQTFQMPGSLSASYAMRQGPWPNTPLLPAQFTPFAPPPLMVLLAPRTNTLLGPALYIGARWCTAWLSRGTPPTGPTPADDTALLCRDGGGGTAPYTGACCCRAPVRCPFAGLRPAPGAAAGPPAARPPCRLPLLLPALAPSPRPRPSRAIRLRQRDRDRSGQGVAPNTGGAI